MTPSSRADDLAAINTMQLDADMDASPFGDRLRRALALARLGLDAVPPEGLPASVWVVFDKDIDGPSIAYTHRHMAMDEAAILAGSDPDNGPWRVCEYRAHTRDRTQEG